MEVASQPWVRGRYRVLHAVGAGGLGSVSYAWDEELQRAVAIKRLFQRSEDTTRALEEAWQEARTLAAIQNPHILTLFDFGTDDQGPYFIMEFLEGETLDRALERGPLNLADAVEMARQVLEGLSAAHGKGILHLDLKPSNLMLQRTASGKLHAKILDFGLARFQKQIDISGPPQGESGGVMGTVYYISPEHLESGALGPQTDLYALGHVLYQSLVGRPAFTGHSIQEVVAHHLESEPASVREYRPDVGPQLADWLHSLMKRLPSDRPADAMEALNHLRRLDALNLTSSRPVLSVAVEPASSPRSGIRPWVAGGVALLLLGSVAGWKMTQPVSSELASSGRIDPPPQQKQTPLPRASRPGVQPLFPPAVAGDRSVTPTAPGPEERAFAADHLAALRERIGQEVVVRGKIVKSGQNRDDSVRYLNFTADYQQSIGLVFFVSDQPVDFSAEKLAEYVGREIEVRGAVQEYRGALQIRVRTPEQIRVTRP
ncbi:MAG: serine/threonine-protein kinase [Candidatus Methylacidiphilales bacterium]|nr:serine/threonine-protein kinase [Candidatus Methylacidiphilales bacterium]